MKEFTLPDGWEGPTTHSTSTDPEVYSITYIRHDGLPTVGGIFTREHTLELTLWSNEGSEQHTVGLSYYKRPADGSPDGEESEIAHLGIWTHESRDESIEAVEELMEVYSSM